MKENKRNEKMRRDKDVIEKEKHFFYCFSALKARLLKRGRW